MALIEPRRKNLRSSGPWAPVPAWVINHPNLTDRALRLYAVLMLMSSAENSTAFPSRRKLAEMMACSVKTVDRALQDLMNIDGVRVEHRFRPGTHEWTSSEYLVTIDNPCSEVATDMTTPRDKYDATVGTDLTLGGVTDDAAEPEVLNQNQVIQNHLPTPEQVQRVWDAYCDTYAQGGRSKKYRETVIARLEREYGDYVRGALEHYRPTQLADRIHDKERKTS